MMERIRTTEHLARLLVDAATAPPFAEVSVTFHPKLAEMIALLMAQGQTLIVIDVEDDVPPG